MSHHHHSEGCCSSHSHEHEEEACGSHHHDHSCESEAHDTCHSHQHDVCSIGDMYLKLADQAWMNVLRGKIEKAIEQHSGPCLDKVALLISETNKKRWKGIFAKGHCKEHFEQELKKIFSDENCKDDSCSKDKNQLKK